MNDRELLELAAKAAGLVIGFSKTSPEQGRPYVWNDEKKKGRWWDPRKDDGDALRLAVKLRIRLNREINCGCDIVEAIGPEDDNMSCNCSTESIEGDPYAATRRAIVRAAAEIGRQMQEGGAA